MQYVAASRSVWKLAIFCFASSHVSCSRSHWGQIHLPHCLHGLQRSSLTQTTHGSCFSSTIFYIQLSCGLRFLGDGETPRNPSDTQDHSNQNQHSCSAHCHAFP